MLPNDDLARWGEPPTDPDELALAEAMAAGGDTASFLDAAPLLAVSRCIEQMVQTVVERVGLVDQAAGVGLRLRVLREAAGRLVTIASTHPAAVALRDLRRVPDEAERITLHTGDRVRLEVEAGRDGYLTVLNVGPRGALHLLHPGPNEAPRFTRGGEPVPIADVELTPPAGKERVWAIWSRVPLTSEAASRLVRPGAQVRDLQRVQDAVERLAPGDWHAVLLELDHEGG